MSNRTILNKGLVFPNYKKPVKKNTSAVIPSSQITSVQTVDSTIIVETDKNVYVTTQEDILEQNYINNAPVSLQVGEITGTTYNNKVNNVNKIGFDTDSGFEVTAVCDGLAKIGMNSTFKCWNVNGSPGLVASGLDTVNFIAGSNVTISANNLSSPKSLTISATGGSVVSAATPTTLGTTFGLNNTSLRNTAVGYCATNINLTGTDNVAIGNFALKNNTTGNKNIALGSYALTNESGNSLDYGNTAIGYCALHNNTTGYGNIAIGEYALSGNNYGSLNIGIGYAALSDNYGYGNVGIGNWAMRNAPYGYGNTALGTYALQHLDYNCNYNVAIGHGAGYCGKLNGSVVIGACAGYCNYKCSMNTVSIGHKASRLGAEYGTVAIGYGAGENITSRCEGAYNLLMGYVAGNFLYCSSYDVLIGPGAGCCITGCSGFNTVVGAYGMSRAGAGGMNVAVGAYAMQCAADNSNGAALICSNYGNVALGGYSLHCNRGVHNVGIGYFSLYKNYCGSDNVSIGACSLICNTSGSRNIAIGTCAAFYNTTGVDNIVIGTAALANNLTGSWNVAIGIYALLANKSNQMVAIGDSSLSSNTTGTKNVAIGSFALNQNTTGSNNVAIGVLASQCSTVGSENFALGAGSLNKNVSGNRNIAIGTSAGCSITTGSNNTIIGTLAGSAGLVCTVLIGAGECERIKVTDTGLLINGAPVSVNLDSNCSLAIGSNLSSATGTYNIAIGSNALCGTTGGSDNIVLGSNALLNAPSVASDNVVIGNCAGRCAAMCNRGGSNVLVGRSAGMNMCCGESNTYVGPYAGENNFGVNCYNAAFGVYAMANSGAGAFNVALGPYSMLKACVDSGTAGSCNNYNSAVGSYSLLCNRGNCNSALGSYALHNFCYGNQNVAVGSYALFCTTSGSANIGIGYFAGCGLTTGTSNTIIGRLPGTAGMTCTVLIGAGTCERARIDDNGLCINGSTLTGDGLSCSSLSWRITPQNSQSADYVLTASDSGKHILHPSTDANARIYTIPANGVVPYPIGTAITFVNETSNVVSIAINSDNLILAGTGTTGTRSLSQYGVATALKIGTTTWYISGTGLT